MLKVENFAAVASYVLSVSHVNRFDEVLLANNIGNRVRLVFSG